MKLTKVKIINWMYFQNETISTNGYTVYVGDNGSGKSTIIDALQMLLLGNKGSKFNSNANAEKRTLESYVRGSVNTFETECLRPNDVCSYLAMEILRDGKYHILGINMEYKNVQGKLSDPRYFYIDSTEIEDDLFIENDCPKTFDKFYKNKNVTIQIFNTLSSYQSKIKELFGLKDDKKYFQTLTKAVGLKNINNCDSFINSFILDENPIDVTTIKNTLFELDKLNKSIENEEKKSNDLLDIENKYVAFDKNNKDINLLEFKKIQAEKRDSENKVKKFSSQNEKSQILINDDSTLKSNNDKAIRLNNIQKTELENQLNNISPDLKHKKTFLEQKQKEYDDIHFSYNSFLSKIDNDLHCIKGIIALQSDIIEEYNYLKTKDFNTENLKIVFRTLRNKMENIKLSTTEEKTLVVKKLKDARKELTSLQSEIESLERNQFTYDPDLVKFKFNLSKELADKYNRDIEVKFLCESLDITDDEWRNAIEGYLGNQRFYIIVDSKYYMDCVKILNKEKNFYKTAIIDTTKLRDIELEKNSLGELIQSSNNYSLNYARYILNRVHRVDNLEDLNKYDISITKDCIRYQGYTVARIDPKIYRYKFIGQKGIEETLNVRKKEMKDLEKNIENIVVEDQTIDISLTKIKSAENFNAEILESGYIDSVDKDFNLFNEISVLSEEIKFYESNPKYLEINEKLSELIDKNNNIEIENKSLSDSIFKNQISIEKNNDFIFECNNFIDECITKIASYSISLDDTDISILNLAKIFSEIKELSNKNIKLQSKLEDVMKKVNTEYNLSYEPIISSSKHYIEERNKINNAIFSSRSDLVSLGRSLNNLFFNKFLNQLYSSVEESKKIIANLNHALSKVSFGDDYYEIYHCINKDPDLETVYNYAQSYANDESKRDVFNYESQDVDKDKVIQIINRYLQNDDIKVRDRIIDYRNFMEFDIIIHNKITKTKKSYNKVSKVQSGGEVQVPFYILSAVAFRQTLDYKRNENTLGLVLYDEAFDKISPQRIKALLDFYRKDNENLQLMIAMPGKLESVINHVETVYAVVRKGNDATIKDVTRDI